MNLALWIVAGLLAVVYMGAGVGKLIVPKEKLAAFAGGGWVRRLQCPSRQGHRRPRGPGGGGPDPARRSTSRRSWCRWLPWVW